MDPVETDNCAVKRLVLPAQVESAVAKGLLDDAQRTGSKTVNGEEFIFTAFGELAQAGDTNSSEGSFRRSADTR